jgi:hypothetical protein
MTVVENVTGLPSNALVRKMRRKVEEESGETEPSF